MDERNIILITSDADNDTLGLFQFINIHYPFIAQFFKIQPIGFIEVGRNRLRVIVDHDRPLAHVPQLSGASDGTPVKFNTASNAVNTASQDHGSVFVEIYIMFLGIICGIKIVGMGRIFGGQRIDPFNEWSD
jgi:hypothetical protein